MATRLSAAVRRCYMSWAGTCCCLCWRVADVGCAWLQGGFATAYQCTCLQTGKEKAVKVVARSSIRDSKSKQKVSAAPSADMPCGLSATATVGSRRPSVPVAATVR